MGRLFGTVLTQRKKHRRNSVNMSPYTCLTTPRRMCLEQPRPPQNTKIISFLCAGKNRKSRQCSRHPKTCYRAAIIRTCGAIHATLDFGHQVFYISHPVIFIWTAFFCHAPHVDCKALKNWKKWQY